MKVTYMEKKQRKAYPYRNVAVLNIKGYNRKECIQIMHNIASLVNFEVLYFEDVGEILVIQPKDVDFDGFKFLLDLLITRMEGKEIPIARRLS